MRVLIRRDFLVVFFMLGTLELHLNIDPRKDPDVILASIQNSREKCGARQPIYVPADAIERRKCSQLRYVIGFSNNVKLRGGQT